jgi:hypothetical protein
MQLSQPHSLKKQNFFSLNSVGDFVENPLSINAWVYFWLLGFIPFVCMSIFVPGQYGFDCCSFAERIEIKKCVLSSFAVPFQE